MADFWYRIGLVMALAVLFVAKGVFARRYGAPANDVPRSADGAIVSRALMGGGLVFWGGLVAWLAWPATLAWSGIGLPAGVRWAGVVGFVAGGLVALWARFTLGRSSTTTAVPAPDSELVTAGPYRWFRHPIYSAGAVMSLGAALLADSWLLLAVAAALLGVLDYRTRREERLLLDRYGDAYRAHMAGTGRWLPRLRPRSRA